VDLEPVAHTLRPGETVTLQLVSSAGLYETIVPSFGTLTISSIQVSVPTADPTAISTH
jgi:ABC-2 type transport system ATP-binding protein